MRISGPSRLKRTPSDEADAIILTFNHRWEQMLTKGKIEVVFRKQGPSNFTPRLIYAYVSAPTSAIVCRMPVIAYSTMPVAKALEFADRGCIEVDELKSYAGASNSLIVMELGAILVARSPITCEYLSQHYNYWPSSTFIPLSKSGVAILDELGEFSSTPKGSKHDK
jgi:predicted transcriptional regulator